jgi:hypothetical protein
MSKLFAQLLLSIMIGVGAAVGVRSDVRGEVHKTFREAKVSFQETAKITVDSAANVKTQVNTAVSVSAKKNMKVNVSANVKASINDNAKVDARTKANMDVQALNGGDILEDVVSTLALDGSLNTNSQTTVGADAQGLELDLKNRTKSTLDVGLDILK